MYTVSEFRAHGGLLGPWLLKGPKPGTGQSAVADWVH